MRNLYLILLLTIPIFIIFLAFFNPTYADLVRNSIVPFIIFAVPYCFLTKDPKRGLLIFLVQTSCLEGAWKMFSYGLDLKLLVYIVRDLLLYATFLNFYINRKKILPEDVLREKIPYSGLILLFSLNIILQLFNPHGYNLLNSLAGSRLFWEMIPLYFMGFYLMRDIKSFRVFFWVCIFCVFFNSIATILQYNWGMEQVSKISHGYYVMIYEWGRGFKETLRPPGLGSDMGFGGGVFCVSVPMFMSLFLDIIDKKTSTRYIILVFFSILLIFGIAGLLFSLSRTALVLAVFSALLYMWMIRKSINKIIMRLSLLVLIAYLIIPYSFSKIGVAVQRYETVKNPVQLLRTVFREERGRFLQAFAYPLEYSVRTFMGNGLGRIGPGSYFFVSTPHTQEELETNGENTLNLSLNEIGTIGVLLWLIFHISIVKEGANIVKHIEDMTIKRYALVPFISTIILLTQWQFGQLINFPNNANFWFIAGTLIAFKYIKHDKSIG